MDLTINNSTTGIDYQTACDSYTWIDGITYTANNNTAQFTLINAAGCDSIVTLNLIINNSTTSTDVVSTCNSCTWIDGITYTANNNTAQFILTNAAGCDSIITLDVTVNSTILITETACDSFTLNNQTYTTSGTYTQTLTNAAGCDSIITLDLTIIPSVTLTIENTFSLPSEVNSCNGKLAASVSGNPYFELDIDNGTQIVSSSGYSLINNLCPGVHELLISDNCGDTFGTQFVIPIDSNYIFNNPFIDSLAQDSLGITLTNCTIYYAGIDTAYIDSIWAIGNTVNVIWNIIDSNGSNFDTTSYVLNNGNGVYWLQLSVFCPTKALGDYFTVTEAIYFENGVVSTANINESSLLYFKLFPNPTTDQVTLQFEGNSATLTIRDAQGKLIQSTEISNNEVVSLKAVQSGIYFFELTTENGTSMPRVVKN